MACILGIEICPQTCREPGYFYTIKLADVARLFRDAPGSSQTSEPLDSVPRDSNSTVCTPEWATCGQSEPQCPTRPSGRGSPGAKSHRGASHWLGRTAPGLDCGALRSRGKKQLMTRCLVSRDAAAGANETSLADPAFRWPA